MLDDISCLLGCTRNSLHVVASEKGVVVGKLVYNEDGDEIDCTKMGIGGKAIPSNIDKVTNFRSQAKFVLLVEKDAAFMRLAEDRFYNRFPCIIITAKGQPDVATRLFLSKLKRDLRIPVLALVDADPYGRGPRSIHTITTHLRALTRLLLSCFIVHHTSLPQLAPQVERTRQIC